MRSLEANVELEGVEFHLFQDGAVNRWSGRVAASEGAIEESVAVFGGSALAEKRVHLRCENVGIGVNQYEALELLLARYVWVVLLEDDVVVSPYYLRLARVLFEQLEDREDVACFSLGFRLLCARHKVEENNNKIMFNWGHWWGEGLWSGKWARVWPYFEEYQELVGDCDFVMRPHEAIVALFRSRGWPGTNTTQDVARDMAISCAGMERVRTVVNRGISTGEWGQHFTPRKFRAMGFDDQELYALEADAVLDRFEWRR